MRYDDRLATVLRLAIGGQAMTRIQWRQLIDLLGTAPTEARGELLDRAYVRLAELSAALPPAERAAILSEPGIRLRSPRLVASLAAHEAQAAQAALATAELDEEQWLDLAPALSPNARALLATRRHLPPSARALLIRLGASPPALPEAEPGPDIMAGTIDAAVPHASSPVPPQTVTDDDDGMAETPDDSEDAPAGTGDSLLLPLDEASFAASPEPIAAFDFTSDTEGRIVWSEAATAPMVVGLSLAGFDLADGTPFSELVRRHQPIRGGRLTLAGAGAIAGEWQVDAAARFDALGGRFAGHAGRFRRAPSTGAETAAAGESGRLREMLHELRTPVSAVQGFAEIIQQQLFGPAPHEYRALAAAVIADSAHLLAGFEELERFARLDTGVMELAAGTSDLADCLTDIAARLTPDNGQGRGFLWTGVSGPLPVPLAPAETERLIWRLLASLAVRGTPGERLGIRLEQTDRDIDVLLDLPAALATLSDDALFHDTGFHDADGLAQTALPLAGMFGTGFSLRLAEAEARTAGGALRREGGMLRLTLLRA